MVVVLFASQSKAGANAAEWSRRFERYAKTSGRPLRILSVNASGDDWAAALPLSDEPAILWDASGKMPPKEIEAFLADPPAGAWRFAVRYAGTSPARGVDSGRWTLGKIRGALRRLFGRISDCRPPAASLPSSDLKRLAPVLASLRAERWTSALSDQARREGRRTIETPVMWAL